MSFDKEVNEQMARVEAQWESEKPKRKRKLVRGTRIRTENLIAQCNAEERKRLCD